MPKLKNRCPKNCRDGEQSFSWYNGKRYYHGKWGTPQADENYRRFKIALLENPALLLPSSKTNDVSTCLYRKAVEHAIMKGNKTLPEEQLIPKWTPYQLRHAAATAIELEHGLDEAQAQLGHTSANMTKRYSKAQLMQREKLARKRHNPFAKNT